MGSRGVASGAAGASSRKSTSSSDAGGRSVGSVGASPGGESSPPARAPSPSSPRPASVDSSASTAAASLSASSALSPCVASPLRLSSSLSSATFIPLMSMAPSCDGTLPALLVWPGNPINPRDESDCARPSHWAAGSRAQVSTAKLITTFTDWFACANRFGKISCLRSHMAAWVKFQPRRYVPLRTARSLDARITALRAGRAGHAARGGPMSSVRELSRRTSRLAVRIPIPNRLRYSSYVDPRRCSIARCPIAVGCRHRRIEHFRPLTRCPYPPSGERCRSQRVGEPNERV